MKRGLDIGVKGPWVGYLNKELASIEDRAIPN